jgi:pyridoxal phosphate enzyme (YggS family)
MHSTVNSLVAIKEEIQLKVISKTKNIKTPQIIAVSKTFRMEHILPLVNYGHLHFGENKVQEAIEKWTKVKDQNQNIKLHFIGKLQTNKVKIAVKIFDYIHSVDNEKLATKIAAEQIKQNKKIKVFIQINIGNEDQKSGFKKENVSEFYKFCKNLNLDVIGTMCIPPKQKNYQNYFLEMNKINTQLNLTELSMGMSEDYMEAAQHNSTFIRIGSKIFGQRD